MRRWSEMAVWKQWAGWLLVDGTVWTMAVLGAGFSVGWAGNLFKFLTILATLLAIFVAVVTPFVAAAEEAEIIDDDGDLPNPPTRKAARFTDAALMLFLAAYGWFFYAALVLIQILCSFWYSGVSKRREEMKVARASAEHTEQGEEQG